MKRSIYNRKKQLLALTLSVMMASSMAAFAACSDDNESSSSSSSSSTTVELTTEKDITNGTFETFNKNEGLNLIGSSVSGWTRGVGLSSTGDTATGSKAVSGIIDTSKDAWDNLTTSKVANAAELSEEEASAQWSSMTAKDKLAYLEAWEKKEENEDKKIKDELSFYQDFNIASKDLPTCENPGARPDSEDTNVLMIHNQNPSYDSTGTYKSLGTAQKFTSSSKVTVAAGTSATFSVWVKTAMLQTSSTTGEAQDAVDKGAYISVTHTVGNTTLDSLEVKNIQADEWTQYTFYFKGSYFSDSTFTIVLGLGQGGDNDRFEYVNGYAFFDDVECELLSNEKYTEYTDAVELDATVNFSTEKSDKIFEAKDLEHNNLAMNFYSEFEELDISSAAANVKDTTEKTSTGSEHSAKDMFGLTTDATPAKMVSLSDLENGDEYEKAIFKNVKDDTLEYKYIKDGVEQSNLLTDKMLLVMSKHGAPYTIDVDKTFTVNPEEQVAISFFVKTSAMNGYTGASVTLNDASNKSTFSAIDTTTISPVKLDGKDNYYDGWQQYFFFVNNDTDETKSFTFTLNFGPTTVLDQTAENYLPGYALFSGFTWDNALAEEAFACVSNTSYAKIVSLVGDQNDADGDSGFDSVAGVSANDIEEGYATPKTYRGVFSDSAYINNANTNYEINEQDKGVNAGLFNVEHKDTDEYNAIYSDFGGSDWKSVFGNATQPLVIYNTEANEKTYGYIGAKTAIAASGSAPVTISLRLKTNASAYVYLIDMDDDSHQNTLSINRKVSYWYDADGNVCASDPTDEHFNEKTNVAFKLQPNGLYKVNTNWTGYIGSDIDKDAYYANLANYEVKDNNLIVAEGGVSYNYNNKWDNEGQDGIAYYGYDATAKTAYADRAKTILVKDFSTAKELAPRYTTAESGNSFSFVVNNTNGDWATVSFYIQNGDQAKNYRLEIWNGDRNGAAVNAGDYVIIDSYSPDALSDQAAFDELASARIDDVSADGEENENYFENAFSFFDTAKFLRYNEDIDENEIGNSYDNYDATTFTAGVAYLKYASETENVYELYANYALSEDTVDADPAESETEEEEEEEETESETNLFLLISSIAIAAVLVLAVVSLIVRKIITKARKKNATKARLNAKPKKEKKVKKAKETKDENSPYND